MRKPEVGAYYKTELGGIIKVVGIDEAKNEALYVVNGYKTIQVWDYVRFPDCLDRLLTPLEIELL